MVMKDLGLGSGFWTGHNCDTIKKRKSARFGLLYTKIGIIQRLYGPAKNVTQIREVSYISDRKYRVPTADSC